MASVNRSIVPSMTYYGHSHWRRKGNGQTTCRKCSSYLIRHVCAMPMSRQGSTWSTMPRREGRLQGWKSTTHPSLQISECTYEAEALEGGKFKTIGTRGFTKLLRFQPLQEPHTLWNWQMVEVPLVRYNGRRCALALQWARQCPWGRITAAILWGSACNIWRPVWHTVVIVIVIVIRGGGGGGVPHNSRAPGVTYTSRHGHHPLSPVPVISDFKSYQDIGRAGGSYVCFPQLLAILVNLKTCC